MEKIGGESGENPAASGEKRPRRKRGGKKAAEQKKRRAEVEAGTRVPKQEFPAKPNYRSQLKGISNTTSLGSTPVEKPSITADSSQAEASSSSWTAPLKRLSLDTRGETLGPRVRAVASSTSSGLSPSRILVISDLHGVLDTPEFLKYDSRGKGKRRRVRFHWSIVKQCSSYLAQITISLASCHTSAHPPTICAQSLWERFAT